MSIAYTGGGTPISHSGNKSVVIYTAANADAAKYSSHANNLEHLQGVAQRLSLDDSKNTNYNFSIIVQILFGVQQMLLQI